MHDAREQSGSVSLRNVHKDDSGGTLWVQMCMKNFWDAILKQPIAQGSSNFVSMVPGSLMSTRLALVPLRELRHSDFRMRWDHQDRAKRVSHYLLRHAAGRHLF